MKTALFDFELPEQLIASEPAVPRDSARMLALSGSHAIDDHVGNICSYLRAGDVMVFNDTMVIPARLTGKRANATVHITLLKNHSQGRWEAFAKPAKKLSAGDIIIFSKELSASVLLKHEDGRVELLFPQKDIFTLLERYGEMPLPPYMKRKANLRDNEQYQTVYARKKGAVAAPTAGLHFTEKLLAAVDNAGVRRVHVTLHVGAGTFQPVKVHDTSEHIMHSEYAELSEGAANTINEARKAGGRVVAVGTTSLRTLESAARMDGHIMPFAGDTNIFITPGYRFKAVDILLTNFHLPKSTLFMLVSAFMGLERMQQAYRYAVDRQYRFYSYGDACLLIPG